MGISHESIYQALYVQGRGALQRELVACLLTGRVSRVPRSRSQTKPWDHVTPDVMISERPAEADDRAVPGHWVGVPLVSPISAMAPGGLTAYWLLGQDGGIFAFGRAGYLGSGSRT